jgi:hypothetical protein
MNSGWNNLCSHRLDFSIRKSPDHRLLASPRGLSQLATSFIAFLRLGIHTHALSSLTIKFTLHTLHATQANHPIDYPCRVSISWVAGINLCFIMPVSIQFSKILVPRFAKLRRKLRLFITAFSSALWRVWWAWVDSNYRPHPYQGCALTN